MIQAIRNYISGTPPVAPPGDRERFEADEALEEGAVVQLKDGGDVEKCSANGSDAFGITLEEADAEDKVRIQYIMPGTVLKGELENEGDTDVGQKCGLNGDRNKFDGNVGGNFLVLRKYEDDHDQYWAEGVFVSAAFFQDAI